LIAASKIANPKEEFLIVDGLGTGNLDDIAHYCSSYPLAKFGRDDFKDSVIGLISLVYDEMNSRRNLFSSSNVKAANIADYRKKQNAELPRITLVINEPISVIEPCLNFCENWSQNGTAANKLYTIAIQGGAFGIHLIFSSLRPTEKCLPIKLFAQCTKVVHGLEVVDSIAIHINLPEAVNLKPGEFFVLVGDEGIKEKCKGLYLYENLYSELHKAGLRPKKANETSFYSVGTVFESSSEIKKDLSSFLKHFVNNVFSKEFKAVVPSIPPSQWSEGNILARSPILSLENDEAKYSVVAFGKRSDASSNSRLDWEDILERCHDNVIILSPDGIEGSLKELEALLKNEKKKIFLYCGERVAGLVMRMQSNMLYENETPKGIMEKILNPKNTLKAPVLVIPPRN
jgi:hypothetical protein